MPPVICRAVLTSSRTSGHHLRCHVSEQSTVPDYHFNKEILVKDVLSSQKKILTTNEHLMDCKQVVHHHPLHPSSSSSAPVPQQRAKACLIHVAHQLPEATTTGRAPDLVWTRCCQWDHLLVLKSADTKPLLHCSIQWIWLLLHPPQDSQCSILESPKPEPN